MSAIISQSPSQIQPQTNPYLTPAYLLNYSSHIQKISSYYQQENMSSVMAEYKPFLQSTFKSLSQYLNLFENDQNMIISSFLSTKVELQLFLGEKLFYLLEKQTKPLAEMIKFILLGYRECSEKYQELLIREKKRKIQVENQKNQRALNALKREVLVKRDYVKDLEDRIRDLEEQNSKIYQKIIDNTKTTISNTLIQSKIIAGQANQFMTTGKYSKASYTPPHNHPSNIQNSSPQKVSHKQLSLKQVQQTILQFLTLKKKQQSISLKRTSIKSYLKYYFKYKFGLNDLSEEMKVNFLAALKYFLSSAAHNNAGNNEILAQSPSSKISLAYNQSNSAQKPLLLLFTKLLEQQIDEQYFWKQYTTKGERIIKIFKRYLNQKQKIELRQLDRLYDGSAGIAGPIPNYSSNKILANDNDRKDVMLSQNDMKHILVNIYKSNTEIETLQMIFNELISSQAAIGGEDQLNEGLPSLLPISSISPKSTASHVPSKQLLNTILSYEIQSYCLRLSFLTNVIKKHSVPGTNYSSLTEASNSYNYTSLQKIILDLQLPQQKYLSYLQKHYQQLKNKQFTYSQLIQIVYGELIIGGKEGKNYGGK